MTESLNDLLEEAKRHTSRQLNVHEGFYTRSVDNPAYLALDKAITIVRQHQAETLQSDASNFTINDDAINNSLEHQVYQPMRNEEKSNAIAAFQRLPRELAEA